MTDCVDSDQREYLPTGITEMLSSLDFIERGCNLCILGESDTGKSYLAIAIVNLPPRKMMGIDSEGIKPGLRDFGFNDVRAANEINSSGMINTQIINSMQLSHS